MPATESTENFQPVIDSLLTNLFAMASMIASPTKSAASHFNAAEDMVRISKERGHADLMSIAALVDGA